MGGRRWIGIGLAVAIIALALAFVLTRSETRFDGSPTASPLARSQEANPPGTASPAAARSPEAAASSEPAALETKAATGSDDGEPFPLAAGATTDPPDPMLSPADLDVARPEVVRRVLSRAIEEARRHRSLAIAPAIVELAASEGSVRVVFDTGRDVEADALEATLDSGRSASVEHLRVFPMLGSGAAKLSPGALLNLIAETPTEQIELDAVHRASLLQSVPQIGADLAQVAGDDGDGFAVAVLDTGVDASHPMFGSRVVEEACFSSTNDCPNGTDHMVGAGAAAPCALPGCDHGTHVAGIAVGDAPVGPLVGVAPHAQLIAINVFSDIAGQAGAYTSDILAAMQHVLALEAFHDIAVVNLSLGGEPFTSTQACNQASPSELNAIGQLRNAGIATVAAAGNDGLTNAVSSPGCLSNVISVGSVGDADGVSSFSNSADFLTLLAPGESIQSAAVGGGTRSASGTSMSTPHVAGAIADLREAVPGASVGEIENALVLSGLPILDARNGITKPRLRVDQAITVLQAASASSGGGGGGGCGLVGIEPFLVLGLVRILRPRRR